MKKFNVILNGSLLLASCNVYAFGMYPSEWGEDKDEGILQLAFTSQYAYQSNNLAELENQSCTDPDNCPPFQFNSFLYPTYGTNPNQAWAYEGSIGYILPGHEIDMQSSFNWIRADAHTSTFGAGNDVAVPDTPIVADFIAGGDGNFNEDFFEAEFTLGQYLQFSEDLSLRLGYGLMYVKIDQYGNSNSAIDGTCTLFFCSLDANTDATIKSKFEGAGPKLTADGQYDLNSLFSLVGGAGAALLFGQSHAKLEEESSFSLTTNRSQIEFVSNTTAFDDTHETVAYTLDAKLGFRMTPIVAEDLSMNIEIGYEGAAYFNTMTDASFSADISSIAPAAQNQIQFEDDNYYNYGPYVTIGMDFR